MQYLPKSELAKLFRAAYEAKTPKSSIHHMCMLAGFFTGGRISQLLNIRGEDVFQRDGEWTIMLRAAKRGNIAYRSLHVDEDAAFDMTPLIKIAQTKGPSCVFENLTRQYLNVKLKEYALAAGINTTFAHSHIFRHSIAMEIFDATQRIGAVSQFLAHRSPSSAFVYLQENDNILAQDAVDAIQLT
jgi:integrase